MYRGCCRYGFVVYQDPNVTDVAVAGLNGLRMGERTLTVRRAEVGAGHTLTRQTPEHPQPHPRTAL